MRNLWLVARREYTQRVRTPAFLVTTLLVFLVLVFGPLVPGLMAADSVLEPLTVAVVDATGARLQARLQPGLEPALLRLVTAETPGEAALTESVRNGDIDAFAVISGDWPGDFSAIIRTEGFVNQGRLEPLARALVSLAQADRATAFGIDAEAAAHLFALDADITLGQLAQGGVAAESDPGKAAVGFIGAMVATMLIYVGILMYGAFVLQGVLEEKTSRVMEVIASSVQPFQLMAGKILGLGLLGLTSYASWLIAYVVLALFGTALAGLDLSLLPASHVLHLGAFFILGYFLYAAMFAAAGSVISRLEDAGAVQTPAMILVMAAMFISMFAMQSPDSNLAVVSSFIPFFAPTVMLMRIFMSEVPAWHIALSYVLLAATVIGVTWLASRIYRIGILSYGSRPTLRQIARFIRS